MCKGRFARKKFAKGNNVFADDVFCSLWHLAHAIALYARETTAFQLLNAKKTKKKGTACCRSLDLSSLLFVEAVLLVELVNTSACVNQLLLARKIGVTLVANFHLDDVGVFGCTRLERSATSTYNSRLMIIRMYTLFHFAHLADFFERFSFRAVLFYRKQKK